MLTILIVEDDALLLDALEAVESRAMMAA